MGNVVARERCPQCAAEGKDTSGDNLIVYDDGTHCFACGLHTVSDGGGDPGRLAPGAGDGGGGAVHWSPIAGLYQDLPHRKVAADICRLHDYQVAEVNGVQIEVANYRDEAGKLYGQKVRRTDVKKFVCKGEMTDAGLWGRHLWKGGTRRLIVTEGEVDCLVVSQLLNGRWPVVSLPNGAGSAVSAFKRDFEFVNSFEQVVLCFDMDDDGQRNAVKAAEMLKPGVAHLVTLPRKDPAEMLANDETARLSVALFEARPYRPDGIVHAREVLSLPKRDLKLYPLPWNTMNRKVYGLAGGAITMVTSGTGMGKSTWVRAVAHHNLKQNRKVGMIMLEERPDETLHDLMSLEVGVPIRRIMHLRETNEQLTKNGLPTMDDVVDTLSDEVYDKAKRGIIDRDLYLYNHSTLEEADVADRIMAKMEYMAVALGCEIIVLDHVTHIVAMGVAQDERRWIDHFLASLRNFVSRTNVHLLLVSQLRKADGKPYEEGGRITLQDLRGSGSLSSIPNSVIAIERDQQAEDDAEKNTIKVRVLKDRLSGFTGVAMALRYDADTGQLREVGYNERELEFPKEFENGVQV